MLKIKKGEGEEGRGKERKKAKGERKTGGEPVLTKIIKNHVIIFNERFDDLVGFLRHQRVGIPLKMKRNNNR